MLRHQIIVSANEVWPPFVLVAGLLLIGAVAADERLFEAVGARVSRSRIGGRGLLVALLGLVAVVTAVLNLDTSVVFLTPVLVHAARRRSLDERPFLYGSLFMANTASLVLPGSNLTNLLVLRAAPESAPAFAADMLLPWIAACGVTTAFLALAFRLDGGETDRSDLPPLRVSVGAGATLVAAVLVVMLPDPALPVLAVGIAATALRQIWPRIDVRALALLFTLTVVLGTTARIWHEPALPRSGGVWATAGIAALASVLVNNLPAAAVLSAHPTHDPQALVLGLDLGPNLAVTGSLSAVLWLAASRAVGGDASIATYSRLGALLVPATLTAALVTSTLAARI